jgi:hypothetical protein
MRLYLTQSRRLANIIESMFNVTLINTSYSEWEYRLPNGNVLCISYEYSNSTKRFTLYNNIVNNISKTNSIKDIVIVINRGY